MVRVSTSLIRIDRMAIPIATNLSLNSTGFESPRERHAIYCPH
jgi:hypothetical protein